ncbi:hypothetical protein Q3C01_35520 [Bradyrhizobium sp. UFLA05-109]
MNVWLGRSQMTTINTKNVQRTNFLLGHPCGTDFVYDEMMVAPGFGEIAGGASSPEQQSARLEHASTFLNGGWLRI